MLRCQKIELAQCAEMGSGGKATGWMFEFSERLTPEERERIAVEFGCPEEAYRAALATALPIRVDILGEGDW